MMLYNQFHIHQGFTVYDNCPLLVQCIEEMGAPSQVTQMSTTKLRLYWELPSFELDYVLYVNYDKVRPPKLVGIQAGGGYSRIRFEGHSEIPRFIESYLELLNWDNRNAH